MKRIQPVDGSDNFGRSLPLSAISLAMFPRQTSLSTDGVVYALVGDTTGRGAIVSGRGNGAYSDNQRLHTSETQRLRDAFVSCELNHWTGHLSDRTDGVYASTVVLHVLCAWWRWVRRMPMSTSGAD